MPTMTENFEARWSDRNILMSPPLRKIFDAEIVLLYDDIIDSME
jgi:hypothetical protein